jgi:hypothetical protein
VRFTRRPVYEAALIGDCSPGEIDAPCFLRPPPNDDPDIRQAASSRRALTVGPSRPSDTAPLCSSSVTDSVGGPLSAVDIGFQAGVGTLAYRAASDRNRQRSSHQQRPDHPPLQRACRILASLREGGEEQACLAELCGLLCEPLFIDLFETKSSLHCVIRPVHRRHAFEADQPSTFAPMK